MGHIKKVLAMGQVEPRTLTANAIWNDLCENIHLHDRNIRLDFSMLEWSGFRAAINHLGKAVEHSIEELDFEEGNPNILRQLMYDVGLPSNSEYFTNRVTIELQKDNTVHFHYRDLRLHWTIGEFKKIAGMFVVALGVLELVERAEFPFADVKEPTRVMVPLWAIQPYDAGHLPMAEDSEHREGIEYVKGLIDKGEKIRPILMDTTGQRMDGFKRFKASQEKGYAEIECIVDPFARMGGQHNQSFIDDPVSEAGDGEEDTDG